MLQNDKKPPSYWRIAIPMLIIFTLLILTLNIVLTASPQLVLRELCLSKGLSADCNDPDVLKQGASYSMIAIGLPAFLCVFTVGFWSAISNRIGRKWLLIVAISGQFFTIFAWFLVYFFPSSLLSGWKWVTIMGGILSSCCGGVLVLYLAVFGAMNDLSSRHPENRLYYYLGFDVLGAICGVIGTQLASWFMSKDPINVALTCVILYLATASFVLLLPETMDPVLQAQDIIWKQVNLIKQIQFAIPNHTKSHCLLTTDFNKVYNRIVEIYKEQNPTWIQSTDDINMVNINDTEAYNDGNDHHQHEHYLDTSNIDVSTSINSSNILESTSSSSLERVPTRLNSSLLDATNTNLNNNNNNDKQLSNNNDELNQYNNGYIDSNAEPSTFPSLQLPELELESPPRYIKHKNATLILLTSLALNTLVYLGHKIVDLLYMKQVYDISSKQYSNLLSYSVITRSVCSMVMFPIFKKYIKTSRGEINVLLVASVVQGVLYFFYPFMPKFWQYSTLSILNFVISILPTAIVRSLLSNTISETLQRYVLSALVAVEVFVVLFGGVFTNVLWILTSKTVPGATYIIFCGILSILAGLVIPFGLKDSNDEFNLRIQMTTQYTKICHLEDKHKRELQALEDERNEYKLQQPQPQQQQPGSDQTPDDNDNENNINSRNQYQTVPDDETSLDGLKSTYIANQA
jgi:MFS family permease